MKPRKGWRARRSPEAQARSDRRCSDRPPRTPGASALSALSVPTALGGLWGGSALPSPEVPPPRRSRNCLCESSRKAVVRTGRIWRRMGWLHGLVSVDRAVSSANGVVSSADGADSWANDILEVLAERAVSARAGRATSASRTGMTSPLDPRARVPAPSFSRR
eukprot:9466450-Pyramimonas_sp.AAC.1